MKYEISTKGGFPSFIPPADEERCGRIRDLEEFMQGWDWVATEQADGVSCTVWTDDDGMHVCGRNFELKEFTESGAGNVYWQAARKYNLEALPAGFALQFEVVGPGIQGNPMGLDELEIRVFTLHSIEKGERVHFGGLAAICQCLGLPLVRIVGAGHGYIDHGQINQIADSVKYSTGNPGKGVVIRSINSNWSFKALNSFYER